MSVEVTALDASGTASESKVLPAIGIWSLANSGTPAPLSTPGAFNTSIFGMSRLNVNLLSSTDFRIGIADYRGDGRPDFRYHARVFYGDSVIPARASARGGSPVIVRGFGFRSNTQATVGGTTASVLATSAGQVVAMAPARPDGPRDIILTDPATGASSVITSAVNYGAGPNDTIKLLSGGNPATPRGGEAQNPIKLQVLDANGVTPVSGASVFLTATPAVGFSACGNNTSCTVFSDESGEVSTRVTGLNAGTITITAQLAPASYLAAKLVQTTLLVTNSSLDLSLSSPTARIAQGATLDISLPAKVLVNAIGAAGRTVNYGITQGNGTLSSASALTDASGIATVNLHLAAMTSEVDVSACVSPQNNPCRIFHVFAIQASSLRLEPVAGSLQFVAAGQIFQPVTVRVFESGTGNPVRGAAVNFQVVVERPPDGNPVVSIGETSIGHNPLPVILASSQVTILSDVDGLATIQPTSAGIPGAVVIQGTASAGVASLPFEAQSFGR